MFPTVREAHNIVQKEPLQPGSSRHLAYYSGPAPLDPSSSRHLADHYGPSLLDPGSSQYQANYQICKFGAGNAKICQLEYLHHKENKSSKEKTLSQDGKLTHAIQDKSIMHNCLCLCSVIWKRISPHMYKFVILAHMLVCGKIYSSSSLYFS